jgi:hypothetical protein
VVDWEDSESQFEEFQPLDSLEQAFCRPARSIRLTTRQLKLLPGPIDSTAFLQRISFSF